MALFLFGVVVLCGSSLLGMIWAARRSVCCWCCFPGPNWQACCSGIVGCGWRRLDPSLGLFCYPETLTVGARASAAATTTLASILFVAMDAWVSPGWARGV